MNPFIKRLNNQFDGTFVQGSFGDNLDKGDVLVFHDGRSLDINWHQITDVDSVKAYAREQDGVYEFPIKFEDHSTIGKLCEGRKNEKGLLFKQV